MLPINRSTILHKSMSIHVRINTSVFTNAVNILYFSRHTYTHIHSPFLSLSCSTLSLHLIHLSHSPFAIHLYLFFTCCISLYFLFSLWYLSTIDSVVACRPRTDVSLVVVCRERAV